MKQVQKLTIKRYTHDPRWYIVDAGGATLYGLFPNVDAAIELANRKYPEAETKVVDDYRG